MATLHVVGRETRGKFFHTHGAEVGGAEGETNANGRNGNEQEWQKPHDELIRIVPNGGHG